MKNNDINISDYRYERKYFIRQLSKYEIESLINLNPAIFSEIYHQRYVNNIYFDSFNLINLHDSVEGATNRAKVRIRWYGDLNGVIKHPVLEIKSKRGLGGSKKSFTFQSFIIKHNTTSKDIQALIHDSQIPANINLLGIKPVLVNRYKRNYFQSVDKKYRITIDTNMVFYNFSSLSVSFLKKFDFGSNVIVELKYQPHEDLTANKVTNHFPFRMTKMSKYVLGVEKTFL